MAETKLLKQIRALVVTMAFLSVAMPSPITYFTWWKDKPENRKVYVMWAIGVIITAFIIYNLMISLNSAERKELATI